MAQGRRLALTALISPALDPDVEAERPAPAIAKATTTKHSSRQQTIPKETGEKEKQIDFLTALLSRSPSGGNLGP